MADRRHYFHFSSFGLHDFASRSLIKVRNQVVDCFMDRFSPSCEDTVLDVGVSAEDHASSNIFEKRYPYTNRITGLSCYDFSELENIYPGLCFKQGDARNLPFEDDSFDYAYSHAVIEHLGTRKQQQAFISELNRVTRKGFFFTTPNRLHPLEFHTGLPFIHYLPKRIHWKIYQLVGKEVYSGIDDLHLLRPRQVERMTHEAMGSSCETSLKNVWWMLFPAILMLSVRKN